jgi:nucleoside 2-deoxyribosyltransferase
MGYISPEYLDDGANKFAATYGSATARKIGNVLGCPNVVTIGEPTEAGPQGYEFLLRDEQKCILDDGAIKEICSDQFITDYLIFPGGFDLAAVLKAVGKSSASVHIDANFEPDAPEAFGGLGREFDTIILSTSSPVFLGRYGGLVTRVCDSVLGSYAKGLLFKENRGGSRYFKSSEPRDPIRTPAHLRTVQHSVGVGDVFDATYIVNRRVTGDAASLAYSSFIAAEYASTAFPDDFKQAAVDTLAIESSDITKLDGVSLPWEDRPSCQIYIAAPDFDYVERQPIEEVVACLKYHNFTPRRPVIENGQAALNATPAVRQRLCDADVKLIDDCQIMLAVMLFNDPGTLIEIGLAVERQMPLIVYDPYHQAENLMLTQLPNLVSASLDEVITAVFKHAAKRRAI